MWRGRVGCNGAIVIQSPEERLRVAYKSCDGRLLARRAPERSTCNAALVLNYWEMENRLCPLHASRYCFTASPPNLSAAILNFASSVSV